MIKVKLVNLTKGLTMSLYRHREDRRGAAELGRDAEVRFCLLAARHGYATRHSTPDQNKMDHWDVAIMRDGEEALVDVKAAKRMSASGQIQDSWVWIEIRRIDGNPGWLYTGRDVTLAFEYADGFALVWKPDLIRHVEGIVAHEYVEYAEDAKYKLYQRRGYKDVITMISVDDIKSLAVNLMEEEDEKSWTKTHGSGYSVSPANTWA